MKTYSIESFNGGLITSPKSTYAFTCITFQNGVKTIKKAAEGTKIVLVLEGELDLILEERHFRLSAGYWMNIPKDKVYGVEVYRTVKPCKFVVLTCLQGSFDKKVNSGELDSLPLMYDKAKYAIFGHESEVMQGEYIKFSSSDERWDDFSRNEAFFFALEGDYAVKTILTETIIPQGHIMFIPKKKKFTIRPLKGRGRVIVITSPVEGGKAYQYVDFLKDKYGIDWNEGSIDI